MKDMVNVKIDRNALIDALNQSGEVGTDEEAKVVLESLKSLDEMDKRFIFGMIKGATMILTGNANLGGKP